MRLTLQLSIPVLLMIFIVAGCKKSSSGIPYAAMAGMRTWAQMQVNSYKDSLGDRISDTTYATIRTQVVPVSSTNVLMYADSSAKYADTLTNVASHASGISSFIKSISTSTTFSGYTSVFVRYDSVAYNAAANSMVWYNYTIATSSSLLTDSTYTISHTP